MVHARVIIYGAAKFCFQSHYVITIFWILKEIIIPSTVTFYISLDGSANSEPNLVSVAHFQQIQQIYWDFMPKNRNSKSRLRSSKLYVHSEEFLQAWMKNIDNFAKFLKSIFAIQLATLPNYCEFAVHTLK